MRPYMFFRRVMHFGSYRSHSQLRYVSKWIPSHRITGHIQAAAYSTLRPPYSQNTAAIPVHNVVAADRITCAYIIPLSRLGSQQSGYFTTPGSGKKKDVKGVAPEKTQSDGIFQRFRNAYKEYGKVLVGVHCATSPVWFGMFYYAAANGLDVVPLLEKMGCGEKIIMPFKSGAGNIAVMYLLYKLATPARYTVTIVGTQYSVKILRHYGYMEQVAEGDSIRELMKDGRDQVKTKVDDRKEQMMDKADEMKEKYEAKKGKFKDQADDMKDKIAVKKKDAKAKFDTQREKLKDRADDLSECAHELKDRIDADENVKSTKRKLLDTTERLKVSAQEFKTKIDRVERVKDMKENLDKAKDKLKDKAYDLKDQFQKGRK